MSSEPDVKALSQLVGTWTTEAAHPATPGLMVHGTVEAEGLEGKQFLIHRARTDHADFPDSISIIGDTSFRLNRDAPGFSQRFTGRFADDGDTILGLWQLCQDQPHWDDDLRITYRRQRASL